MKRKLLPLIPYAIVLAADFYLLPLLIRGTGSAMFMMLFAIPVIAFVCALVYGARQGSSLLLPLTAAVLFAPTIFLFYNASAWIYMPIYAVLTFAGSGIGRSFCKKK